MYNFQILAGFTLFMTLFFNACGEPPANNEQNKATKFEKDESLDQTAGEQLEEDSEEVRPQPVKNPPQQTDPEPPNQPPAAGGLPNEESITCLETNNESYFEKGPYQVVKDDQEPGFSIWSPEDMDNNCKKPVIAWGNGTGVSGSMTGTAYGHYGEHLASWGFVVIASHADGGAGNQGGEPLSKGIDLIIDKYKDSIAPLAGTMGHSQGGKAALSQGVTNEKVGAIVSLQGYGALPKQPTLFLTGSRDQNLAKTGLQMFGQHPGPAYLVELSGADHYRSPTTPGARDHGKKFAGLATALFRCYLAEDGYACKNMNDANDANFCDNESFSECRKKLGSGKKNLRY